MIVDGMDQQKHCYPKSQALKAKEFASWSRPRMQATTVICHGHAIVVGLSPQNTKASGSRTMELIAYMMTKPLKYIHWSNVFLHIEADNCSRQLLQGVETSNIPTNDGYTNSSSQTPGMRI